MAPNLFYGTGIPASILVLNRDKPATRKGKALFIDASGEFEEGSNQNRLRDQDIEHISGTFHAYADVEKYAQIVPLAEIEKNEWNLNISRYVDTSEEEERIDVAQAVRKLRELERGAHGGRNEDESVSGRVADMTPSVEWRYSRAWELIATRSKWRQSPPSRTDKRRREMDYLVYCRETLSSGVIETSRTLHRRSSVPSRAKSKLTCE